MKDMEQVILHDAYHGNPKALAWAAIAIALVFLWAWIMRSKR